MRGPFTFSMCLLSLFLATLSPNVLADAGAADERPPKNEIGRLPADHLSSLRNRVQDLEREVNWMKQEIRFVKDQNQNLDRRVDDLRTRHV